MLILGKIFFSIIEETTENGEITATNSFTGMYPANVTLPGTLQHFIIISSMERSLRGILDYAHEMPPYCWASVQFLFNNLANITGFDSQYCELLIMCEGVLSKDILLHYHNNGLNQTAEVRTTAVCIMSPFLLHKHLRPGCGQVTVKLRSGCISNVTSHC